VTLRGDVGLHAFVLLMICIAPVSANGILAPREGTADQTAGFNITVQSFAGLMPVLVEDMPDMVEHMVAVAEHPDDLDAMQNEHRQIGLALGRMYRAVSAVQSALILRGRESLPPDLKEILIRAEDRFGDLDKALDQILEST
jgi:hypothetical protein